MKTPHLLTAAALAIVPLSGCTTMNDSYATTIPMTAITSAPICRELRSLCPEPQRTASIAAPTAAIIARGATATIGLVHWCGVGAVLGNIIAPRGSNTIGTIGGAARRRDRIRDRAPELRCSKTRTKRRRGIPLAFRALLGFRPAPGRASPCARAEPRVALGQIREDWSQTRIPLRFPEGLPNLAPLDSIRITDSNAIIRAVVDAEDPGAPLVAELVVRRWSWPGPGGKPVYNFRSEGREFTRGRCLIVADGFYEFTAPADPKQKRKDKWLFTKAGEDWFCIAGLWRAGPAFGEAYTMLTCAPGLDVAPYHSRQVAVLDRADWARGSIRRRARRTFHPRALQLDGRAVPHDDFPRGDRVARAQARPRRASLG